MNEFGQCICLNMIVKNEAPVIRRCLDSVRSLIDTWVIVDTGSSDGTQQIIRELLAAWHEAGALSDCPLPELFRRLRSASPRLTIGQFHDGLRQFHQEEKIYLHPWTGPLCDLPEPTFALLLGHEIVYYVSLR